MSRTIYVYDSWSQNSPTLIGRLFVDDSKNTETYSFEYEKDWIQSNASVQIDPDLFLYSGRQFTPVEKSIFGVFSDSCPDRWGRLLMQRREAIQARKENRKPRKLTESDFLLGVFDESRMGGLRFSLDEGKTFESSDYSFATPPYVDLRKLEAASLSFEKDESGMEEQWLNILLAPGSSLGGARPKATVKDVDNSLWIAKFPSRHDSVNIGAWEKVTHDLAKLCGINVPEARLEKFSDYGSTFLVKRFDRIIDKRIHFSSAMTLLGKTDGDSESSYLDIVSFIKSQGKKPKEDLVELWKRVVFSMAVTNTDDHLRNHGFLLQNGGWVLSPMYDVNPVPYGNSLSLFVDDSDPSIDIELAIETAKFYDIEKDDAESIADYILRSIKNNWVSIAKQCGLSHSSIEQMRPAFEM